MPPHWQHWKEKKGREEPWKWGSWFLAFAEEGCDGKRVHEGPPGCWLHPSFRLEWWLHGIHLELFVTIVSYTYLFYAFFPICAIIGNSKTLLTKIHTHFASVILRHSNCLLHFSQQSKIHHFHFDSSYPYGQGRSYTNQKSWAHEVDQSCS